MSVVNFNDSSEFIKDLKIFNDGKAGVVENVKVRIEKKASSDPGDKTPNYKLIASDGKGEVNEGFYYQEPGSKAFNNYQAQRLIMLARGVLGDDVTFPVFSTPVEALDGVMKMVAPELSKRPWRVAVCYGTIKRQTAYLSFKPFGRYIQNMSAPSELALEESDATERGQAKTATPASELLTGMKIDVEPTANLDWLTS